MGRGHVGGLEGVESGRDKYAQDKIYTWINKNILDNKTSTQNKNLPSSAAASRIPCMTPRKP